MLWEPMPSAQPAQPATAEPQIQAGEGARALLDDLRKREQLRIDETIALEAECLEKRCHLQQCFDDADPHETDKYCLQAVPNVCSKHL